MKRPLSTCWFAARRKGQSPFLLQHRLTDTLAGASIQSILSPRWALLHGLARAIFDCFCMQIMRNIAVERMSVSYWSDESKMHRIEWYEWIKFRSKRKEQEGKFYSDACQKSPAIMWFLSSDSANRSSISIIWMREWVGGYKCESMWGKARCYPASGQVNRILTPIITI